VSAMPGSSSAPGQDITVRAVEVAHELLVAFAAHDLRAIENLLVECRDPKDGLVPALVLLTHQGVLELAERREKSVPIVRQALVSYALTAAGGAELAMEHAARNADQWSPGNAEEQHNG
jgi:hypothetical protein